MRRPSASAATWALITLRVDNQQGREFRITAIHEDASSDPFSHNLHLITTTPAPTTPWHEFTFRFRLETGEGRKRQAAEQVRDPVAARLLDIYAAPRCEGFAFGIAGDFTATFSGGFPVRGDARLYKGAIGGGHVDMLAPGPCGPPGGLRRRRLKAAEVAMLTFVAVRQPGGDFGCLPPARPAFPASFPRPAPPDLSPVGVG